MIGFEVHNFVGMGPDLSRSMDSPDASIESVVARVRQWVRHLVLDADVVAAVQNYAPMHPAKFLGPKRLTGDLLAAMKRPATFVDSGGETRGWAHGEVRHPNAPPDGNVSYGKYPGQKVWAIPIIVETAACDTEAKREELIQGAVDVARFRAGVGEPPSGRLFYFHVSKNVLSGWTVKAVPI